MAKSEQKKLPACDVRMTGSQARVILKNGIVRAGQVVAEWSDAIMLLTQDEQTVIIYRDSIAEMWEGLGPKEEEKKGEDKA
mgnify:FL=1